MLKLSDMESEEFFDELIEQVADISDRDVAIIGMSGRFPLAENVEKYWHNIINGVDCVGIIPEARKRDIDEYLLKVNQPSDSTVYMESGYLGDIDKFDYKYFKISPNEAISMDPSQRMFLEAAFCAIEDSGYGGGKIRGTKTGIYVGHGVDSGYRNFLKEVDSNLYSISIPGNLRSMIPSRVSYLLDLKGPSIVVDTACSSSLVAVHYACQAIRNGECEMAIAGSVKFNLFPLQGDENSGLESSSGRTRAFDEDSDGFGTGEGLGVIVLKPLNRAIEDKDNIYAVIKGSAINQDGKSIGLTAPNPQAQEDVILSAWKDAGIDPSTITYIEAHGTGTKLGDPVEIDGLQRAFTRFTNKYQFCSIGSVKTNIGHSDHFSGLAGLIKAVMTLRNRKLPPTIHFKRPNNKIMFPKSPVYINDCLSEWNPDSGIRRCAVSSFGLSGTNCHVILEEAPEYKTDMNKVLKPHILTLSARNKSVLDELINKYKEYVFSQEKMNLEDICYTANTCRDHFNCRLAIVVEDEEDLRSKITKLKNADIKEFVEEGIFFSERMIYEKDEISLEEMNNAAVKKISKIKSAQVYSVGDLHDLCKLYVGGAFIEWGKLYDGNNYIVSLPTYPFEHLRCWPDLSRLNKNEIVLKNNRVINNGAEVCEIDCQNNEFSIEDRLVKIWEKVIGSKGITVDDSFFELGGDSLVAIKLELEMKKNGLQIESSDVLKYQTVRNICSSMTGNIKNECVSEENQNESVDKNGFENHSHKKVLDDIEPFNDFFYRHCFFNSVFPVVRHLKKSILPFLINDIVVYVDDKTEKGLGLGADYIQHKAFEEVIDSVGIAVDTKMLSENITEDIIKAISQNRPVVVWVDCYYEPLRTDTYMKVHWSHTLLIYGYDSIERKFSIIEHKYRQNLSYEKRSIDYSDMENCYKGYLDLFHKDENIPAFFEFYIRENSQNTKKNKYISDFIDALEEKKSIIFEGVEYLTKTVQKYKTIVFDKSLLDENMEELISNLNSIIAAKQVEEYKIRQLFGDENKLTALSQEILNNWDYIRSVVVKYKYSSIYKLGAFEDSFKSLTEILNCENEFYNTVFSI